MENFRGLFAGPGAHWFSSDNGLYDFLLNHVFSELAKEMSQAPARIASGLDQKAVMTSPTTIFFVPTKDGAVGVADSRITYVSSEGRAKPAPGSITKLIPILDRASLGYSGLQSSGQRLALLLEEVFEMHDNLHEDIFGEESRAMSARSMANLVSRFVTFFIWCVPIFAVYDVTRKAEEEQVVRIFAYGSDGAITEIVDAPHGVGSGFEAIQGLLAKKFRQIRDMKAEEALPLLEEIMVQATKFDNATGGDFHFHLLTAREVKIETPRGTEVEMVLELREEIVAEDEWNLRDKMGHALDNLLRGRMDPDRAQRILGIIRPFYEIVAAKKEDPSADEKSGGDKGAQ